MIQLANNNTKEEVRKMWKICFDDSDEFMDLYFSEKYRNENTLIYFEENRAVASLQMLPYQFTFCGEEAPAAYISGACTLPEYQNRGYMSKLMIAAFELMCEREILLSILIPAEAWLYDYYAKFGYEKVFFADEDEIPLLKILQKSKDDLNIAYAMFDKLFREKDFCVQKTKADFITIVKDAEIDGFPPKANLSGMARIIDAKKLLAIFTKKYPEKELIFENEKDLCRLFFENQHPIMNLMLE
jgi:predicted acetyltransferase